VTGIAAGLDAMALRGADTSATTTAPATIDPGTTVPTTVAPATTAPPPVKPAPVAGPATPELAAQGLYDRWVAGDSAGAAAYATDVLVTDLFSSSGAGARWTFMGCTLLGEGYYCQFSTGEDEGSVTMHVANLAVVGDGSRTGFVVDQMEFF
jgi:hypothetical protein